MYRSVKCVIGGVAALFLATSGALPASATEPPDIDPATLNDLTSSLTQLGVDPSMIDGLLAKYAAGEAWDNSSGTAPVSISEYRQGITDYERAVYPDGSVSVTSVEHPTEVGTAVSSRSAISECTYLLSTGVASYTNCKIEKNNGVLTMMFHANYYQYSGGAGASLTNTWDWDIQAAGGACQKDSLSAPSATKVRLRAYCTIISGIGSSYPYLDLDVTSGSANVNANW